MQNDSISKHKLFEFGYIKNFTTIVLNIYKPFDLASVCFCL